MLHQGGCVIHDKPDESVAVQRYLGWMLSEPKGRVNNMPHGGAMVNTILAEFQECNVESEEDSLKWNGESKNKQAARYAMSALGFAGAASGH